jgi:hypothetical protein
MSKIIVPLGTHDQDISHQKTFYFLEKDEYFSWVILHFI